MRLGGILIIDGGGDMEWRVLKKRTLFLVHEKYRRMDLYSFFEIFAGFEFDDVAGFDFHGFPCLGISS